VSDGRLPTTASTTYNLTEMTMDNMEAFHMVSTMQEPRSTFLTLNLMRRARDMAMQECCSEPRAYELVEVRDAIAECFPDIWRAWREWAGPGSDCADFDTFKPVRYAAHHAYERLNLKMCRSGDVFRIEWTVAEMAAQMEEDEPESYQRWLAEDKNAVRHAIERLTFMGVFCFDGTSVRANDDTWTIDYLREVSAAYKWEGNRLNVVAEAFNRETERLLASGCNTLAELEAQTKQ
jgi:hypothetical protein